MLCQNHRALPCKSLRNTLKDVAVHESRDSNLSSAGLTNTDPSERVRCGRIALDCSRACPEIDWWISPRPILDFGEGLHGGSSDVFSRDTSWKSGQAQEHSSTTELR